VGRVSSLRSDCIVFMDDNVKANRVEETELWVLSARQTMALESLAISLRYIIGTVEIACGLYLLFWLASAIVNKISWKAEG
jgi:hypothetical protein